MPAGFTAFGADSPDGQQVRQQDSPSSRNSTGRRRRHCASTGIGTGGYGGHCTWCNLPAEVVPVMQLTPSVQPGVKPAGCCKPTTCTEKQCPPLTSCMPQAFQQPGSATYAGGYGYDGRPGYGYPAYGSRSTQSASLYIKNLPLEVRLLYRLSEVRKYPGCPADLLNPKTATASACTSRTCPRRCDLHFCCLHRYV